MKKPETLVDHGSTHYQGSIEPAQYIHANGLPFFEGNVVKYVTRHRRAKGTDDMMKALHYCAMILEMDYGVVTTFSYGPKKEDEDGSEGEEI